MDRGDRSGRLQQQDGHSVYLDDIGMAQFTKVLDFPNS